MHGNTQRKAFTQRELLVIVAVLGLLVALLLAGVESELETHEQAVCLANLRQIAVASHLYAAEDEREQIVPFHRMMVSAPLEGFYSTEWSWRTAVPFTIGGRTPVTPMHIGALPIYVMMDPSEGGNGLWTERTRPLNPYLDGSGGLHGADRPGAAAFHCPADTGYPDVDWIDDSPPASANIPCYDFLGSSYRVSRVGLIWVIGSQSVGSFTVTPWGHTASSLDGPLSETVLYTEPLFHSFASAAARSEPTHVRIPGWHGQVDSDHVAYVDGSARMTKVGLLTSFTDPELQYLDYTPQFPDSVFLRRGRTWRMDVHPTPGSLIRVFTPDGQCLTPDPRNMGYTGWPFDNYQFNLPPE